MPDHHNHDRIIKKYNSLLALFDTDIRVISYSELFYKLSNGRCLKSGKIMQILDINNELNKKYINELLSTDELLIKEIKKLIKTENSRKGAQKFHEKFKKEGYPAAYYDRKPWNKGLTKETDDRVVGWNTGLNKNNDPRMKKLSDDRKGAGNPMFGKHMSIDDRLQKSIHMKKLIAEGKFTPNVHNSNTHLPYEYKGIKFRSSWEYLYFLINEDNNISYETIRIPYKDKEGEKHTYIVDFVDHERKKLIEIKPSCHKEKSQYKFAAAREWCNDNGYEFIVIDENWFLLNICKLDNIHCDESFRIKVYKDFKRYENK